MAILWVSGRAGRLRRLVRVFGNGVSSMHSRHVRTSVRRDRQSRSWVDKGGYPVGLIESNRRAIDGNTCVRRYASPALFSLETKLIPRLKQNASGRAPGPGLRRYALSQRCDRIR